MALAGCGSQVAGTPQAGPAPASPSVQATDAPSTEPVPPTESFGPTQRSTPTSSAPTADTSTTPIRTLLPDPPTDRKHNEFGDVVALPGTTYGLYRTENGQDKVLFVYRVNSIKVDKVCAKSEGTEGTAKPENKHFVVIDVDVDLRSLTPQEAQDEGVDFTGRAWEAFDAKGKPQTGIHSDASYACEGDNGIGTVDEFAQGSLNSGLAVVDVDAPKGTVLLKTAGMENGWEFAYG